MKLLNKSTFFLLCYLLLLFSGLNAQNNGKNNPVDTTATYDFVENKFRTRKSALTVSTYASAMDMTLWDKKIISGKTGYGIHTSYELKLLRSHSLKIGSQLFLTNKKYENLKFYCTYRFYHNLNKRIQLGKTGDNFSANYFFIEPAYFIERSPYILKDYEWDFDNGGWMLNYKKDVAKFSRVWIGYGWQRTIVSNFYVDLNAGLDLQDIGNIDTPYFHLYLFTQLSFGFIIL